VRFVLYAVSSPYAAEAVETAGRLGWEIAACVRNLPDTEVPSEVPEIVEADDVAEALLDLPFAVPLITPGHRRSAIADARLRGFGEIASLFDPTAVVAQSSTFAEGAYVNARAIVAAGVRAGFSCTINRGASIGHHCLIADYVTFGPGVISGGGCRFGPGAFLGAGAVIAPEVAVAANAFIGAGAVVVHDVPDGAVVVGNPGRVLRYGAGYGGVGVPATALGLEASGTPPVGRSAS
jgi:sugar O-acyltransferase (sialic acid O-acetyltransferase NeuD family)